MIPLMTPKMTMPAEPMPDPCQDGQVDAIVDLGNMHVLVFRQEHYMILGSEGIKSGYPRPIADFQGLSEGGVDAVLFCFGIPFFSLPNRLYIFRGSQVFLYEDEVMRLTFKLAEGYPKPIGEVYPGVPDDIDAVFRWGRNGVTYFIKGN